MLTSVFDPARPGRTPPDERLADAARAFAPISLAELEGARLMDRVDTKFVLPWGDIPGLLDGLGDGYRALEVGGERWAPYTTLYFDTPSRRCYLDHHNGRLNRRKYRMRQYGQSGQAFFEVKLKSNRGRTVKQREPIAAIRTELGPVAHRLIRSATGLELELAPAILNRFVRLTLVGRGRADRVTIDTAVEFDDPAGRHARLAAAAIVEIKANRAGDKSLMRTRLQDVGRRPTGISKYCIGSLLLDPTLKHNRFKRTLRAVQALS